MISVAVGCSTLTKGKKGDGIASYTSNLIEALEGEAALTPYVFKGEALDSYENVISGPSFPLHVLKSQFGFNSFSESKLSEVSLVHCTDHRIPRLNHKPLVATIFDAVPFHHPEWARSSLRTLKNFLMRRSGRWPDRVISASNFAAEEVARYWGVPEDLIRVIPLAVNEDRFRCAPSSIAKTRVRFGLPESYYLFIGTLQPRKNLERLVAAHRCLNLRQRLSMPLVIVGGRGWLNLNAVQNLDSDPGIIRLGFVENNDLNAILMGATALVVPSLHEGFGLPVLEGYAAGVPVLCSNSSSLVEVAQGGALHFDPMSVAEIYDALQIVQNELARFELVEAGRAVLPKYSWKKTATETLSVYEEVL